MVKDAGWTDWVQLALAIAVAVTAAAVPLSAFWRRPKLRLKEDVAGDYFEIAGGVEPRIRLVATNARFRRAAYRVRVDVLGYRRQSDATWTWLGNRPLRWLGGGTEETAVVYAGARRPIEFGGLFWHVPEGWQAEPSMYWKGRGVTPEMEEASRWHFHISLASGSYSLEPGSWVIRLVVGAEDGTSRTHDVDLAFADAQHDAAAASRTVQLAVRDAE